MLRKYWPTIKDLHQLFADTVFSLDGLFRVIDDWDRERERESGNSVLSEKLDDDDDDDENWFKSWIFLLRDWLINQA